MDKQIFAKVGVFVLLGVNVAAYYFIWPHKDGATKNEARASAQENGQTQLLPAKKDVDQGPKSGAEQLPIAVFGVTVPLEKSDAPATTTERLKDGDAVQKLLERINNEKDPVKPRESPTIPRDAIDFGFGLIPETPPVQGPILPNADRLVVVIPEEKRADSLPPLPDFLRKGESKPGVIAATISTPPTGPGPWLVNMETIGPQTQLLAKLRTRTNVEFKILCDRVEMKAPSGAVQALGNVTFSGAGIKGTCQRLSIPLHETQLVFEMGAHLLHEMNPGSSLRGDRIVWESAAVPAAPQTLLIPAEYQPTDRVVPLPLQFGPPK